ncbi:Multiple antibiotic resistance protein marR [Actinoplanes sp. SE50]|nr:Multiple antibiotic resistance protein marR [Actinoplanes sp. SE50/110]ATO82944.1 Multiple antibiotic resistance protein marR [Actinoplanes sp. SE50]SLM00352.1 MarR family transcriptional regulator [Actinoplanes sp. SE50/110]
MLASRAFVGITVRALAAVPGEVTLPQFRTLVVLAARGPQRSIDIAEELGVNPSTGTRMLDRLIGKGLVRRTRSATDRRVVRLRLTPDGQRLVEQILDRRRRELERLVDGNPGLWSPPVIEALTAFATAAGEQAAATERSAAGKPPAVGAQAAGPSGPDWWLGWTPGDAVGENIA